MGDKENCAFFHLAGDIATDFKKSQYKSPPLSVPLLSFQHTAYNSENHKVQYMKLAFK